MHAQHFVLIIATILYLSHTTSSEIITCDATNNIFCGPCKSSDICNLQCLGRDEVCLESSLSCSEGTECRVDCASPNACSDATINAPYATSLSLNCHDITSCDATTLNVANNADITINCGGADGGCKDLVLNGQFAGNVDINCIGFKSCNGMKIYCGNGDCNINCFESSGAVCSGLTLQCGSGECSIDCSSNFGEEKCDSSTLSSIDTTKAQKFECIGSATDCFNAPPPFAHPTVSPTVIPTKLPTNIPTLRPTQIPTTTPTVNPTNLEPTLRPTNIPTNKPTLKPTNKPTNTPTFSPTPNPTSKPTISTRNPSQTPSTKPTVSPTMKPTVPGQTRIPSVSPTLSPSDKPTFSPVTTTTAEPTKAGDTLSPTLSPTAPTPRPISQTESPTKVITINPSQSPTETAIKTPSPTYNQLDSAECCHCLIASNKTLPIRGCGVDPQCQSTICDFDGFCCNDHWDKTCVFYASEQCEKTTPRTTVYNEVLSEARDLDLVWKLALVVFAVMIIFVSCCCVIMRIKRWCSRWYKGQIFAKKNNTEDMKKGINGKEDYHEVVVDGYDDVKKRNKQPIKQESVPIAVGFNKKKRFVSDDTESESSRERGRKKRRNRTRKKKTKRSSRRKRTKKKRTKNKRRKKSSETSVDDGDIESEGLSSSSEIQTDSYSSSTDIYSGKQMNDIMKRMKSSVGKRHSI